MKKAEDFKETLMLVMEDYEYTLEEFKEDIGDLLMSDFTLTEKENDSKKYMELVSEKLDKKISIFIKKSSINGEEIIEIESIKTE